MTSADANGFAGFWQNLDRSALPTPRLITGLPPDPELAHEMRRRMTRARDRLDEMLDIWEQQDNGVAAAVEWMAANRPELAFDWDPENPEWTENLETQFAEAAQSYLPGNVVRTYVREQAEPADNLDDLNWLEFTGIGYSEGAGHGEVTLDALLAGRTRADNFAETQSAFLPTTENLLPEYTDAGSIDHAIELARWGVGLLRRQTVQQRNEDVDEALGIYREMESHKPGFKAEEFHETVGSVLRKLQDPGETLQARTEARAQLVDWLESAMAAYDPGGPAGDAVREGIRRLYALDLDAPIHLYPPGQGAKDDVADLQERFVDETDLGNPTFDNVGRSYNEGREFGATQFVTVHGTDYYTTEEGRALLQEHSAEQMARRIYRRNQERFADLEYKAEQTVGLTPAEQVELEQLAQWRARHGITARWLSAAELETIDPYDPASGGVVPAEQLGWATETRRIQEQHYRIESNAYREHHFAEGRHIRDAGNAGAASLAPDAELPPAGGGDGRELVNTLQEITAGLAHLDPNLAERWVRLLQGEAPDPDLWERLRTVGAEAGLPPETLARLEDLGTAARGSDAAGLLTRALWQRSVEWDGLDAQREVNDILRSWHEALQLLHRDAREHHVALDAELVRRLDSSVARYVELLGRSGHGNQPEVYQTLDGEWHLAPWEGVGVLTAAEQTELTRLQAWIGTALHHAFDERWLETLPPDLQDRMMALRDTGGGLARLYELNHQHPGAGVSSDLADLFEHCLRNPDAAFIPVDAHRYVGLQQIGEQAAHDFIWDRDLQAGFESLLRQIKPANVDWDDPESVRRHVQILAGQGVFDGMADDGRISNAVLAAYLLQQSSPRLAALRLLRMQLQARYEQGELSLAAYRRQLDALHNRYADELYAAPPPAGLEAYFAELTGTRLDTAHALIADGHNTPADWLRNHNLAGVRRLARDLGVTPEELLTHIVDYLESMELNGRVWYADQDQTDAGGLLAHLRQLGAGAYGLLSSVQGMTVAALMAALGLAGLVVIPAHAEDALNQVVLTSTVPEMVRELEMTEVTMPDECLDPTSGTSRYDARCQAFRRVLMAQLVTLNSNYLMDTHGYQLLPELKVLGGQPPVIELPVVPVLDVVETEGSIACGDKQDASTVEVLQRTAATNVEEYYYEWDAVKALKGRNETWWSNEARPGWVGLCEAAMHKAYPPAVFPEPDFDPSSAAHLCLGTQGCAAAQTSWERVDDLGYRYFVLEYRETGNRKTNAQGDVEAVEWQATCRVEEDYLVPTGAIHTLEEHGHAIEDLYAHVDAATHPGAEPAAERVLCLDMEEQTPGTWRDVGWVPENAGRYDHDIRVQYPKINIMRNPDGDGFPIVVRREEQDTLNVHLLRARNVPAD